MDSALGTDEPVPSINIPNDNLRASMWLAKTFTDQASGKDTKRPQLEALMSFVREGDTVIVHSMDRLAINLDDLRRIVQTLTSRGVRIEFVKEHLSFTGEAHRWPTLCYLLWVPSPSLNRP